jgi:hypothetical protein
MCGLECHLSGRVLCACQRSEYSLVRLANPQRLRNKLCADADYLFDYPNCNWGSLWIFALEHQAPSHSQFHLLATDCKSPSLLSFLLLCVFDQTGWRFLSACTQRAVFCVGGGREWSFCFIVKESGALCLLKKCSSSRGVDGQVADIKIDV